MIRVSTTQKNLRQGIEDVAPDGFNTLEQLAAMRSRGVQMLHDLGKCGNSCGRFWRPSRLCSASRRTGHLRFANIFTPTSRGRSVPF